uniref:sensor histidine kinase n=1 Tax=Pararhizobium sp. IMCC3301 TaxID=3067904 RepID=UPI002741EBB2|nr:PAS domain-containing protein [Pararhizobium sp. IMCC3301]
MKDISSTALAIDPAEIIATLREGLLVLTEDLIVEYASDRFLQTFGVDKTETLGHALADLGNGQWNIPALLEPLSEIIAHNDTLEDFEIEHEFEHIGRKVMRLNARKTVRLGNQSKLILVAIEDVTKAADDARELGRLRRLSEGIVDTLREPLLVLDSQLRIIEASRAFYRTFKVEAQHTIGEQLVDLGDGQWANAELVRLLTEIIPEHTTVEDFEIDHDFPNIGRRLILLNARKIFREGNNTKTLLLAMEDITDQRRLEDERREALDQSYRLMEELNHRVMNSLSMIGAVITMEGRTLSDQECRTAFSHMRNRINSVGKLYRHLSQTAAVDTVNADIYLGSILKDTISSFEDNIGAVELDLSIEAIPLSTRTAVPLGLIVNELATNSLKYAFKNRDKGLLGFKLEVRTDRIEINLWDDGPGIDGNARVDSGIGQKLVQAFVEQLDGELSVSSGPTGTRHVLKIPVIELSSNKHS